MDDVVELPAAKRVKTQPGAIERRRTSSRLFSPFRTVGLVSPTEVPFTSIPLGKTTFQITTSVGRHLQTYDLRRGLNLVFVSSPPCPRPITATCAYRDRVFASWGGLHATDPRGIWVFKRGRCIGQLENSPAVSQQIEHIIVLGAWILGCGRNALEVWKNETYEHYTTILPSASQGHSAPDRVFSGHICTLPTLLNKVLVGRSDGLVEIYNVSTGRLVHTILAPSAHSGPVTALCPATALCLVAIAYSDGSLVMHDVESDEQILQLRQGNKAKPITAISFRTDGLGAGPDGRQDGVLATASREGGDVTFWDLNRGGKVAGVLRGAHQLSESGQGSGISKVEFLAGQPVLITSGMDNALHSWVFDQAPFSPVPRILHSRSGHAAPVAKLRFLPAATDGSDAAGKWLLSAGQDRSLWGFSLRKDGQSTELSQGNVKHKAKKFGLVADSETTVESFKAAPIVDMACCLNRDGGMGAVNGLVWANPTTSNADEVAMTGWESVVTAHSGDRFARTWSWGRKKAGRWALETSDHQPVTSVAITACGTFTAIGSSAGCLDLYNLQSGAHRRKYPPPLTSAQVKKMKLEPNRLENTTPRGHKGAITGIVVDSLNKIMVSSSLDGTAIFWEFSTGKVADVLRFEDGAAATAVRYNPVSGLVALSCDDLCIRVVDMETRKIVRELWGCIGQIYDFCFSHDGRWIVACSMDSVIRVFDLVTGHLVDAFRTHTCTNLAFSSTGEFLATTHAGRKGISIWTNRSLFTHISTKHVDESTGIIDLSEFSEIQAAGHLAIAESEEEEAQASIEIAGHSDVDQLDMALLTLSQVPQSRWQTLLNLDNVRQRNKPIQPPEKPKAAPFFLGSSLVNGGSTPAAVDSKEAQRSIDKAEQSRISRLASVHGNQSSSQMSKLLNSFEADLDPDPSPISKHLASLPPSASDLEIRSLTLQEMQIFVRALTAQLGLKTYFELVNTWMSVFLKLHGDLVSEVKELKDAILLWRTAMNNEERRLGHLVGYTRGVVDFLRSSR